MRHRFRFAIYSVTSALAIVLVVAVAAVGISIRTSDFIDEMAEMKKAQHHAFVRACASWVSRMGPGYEMGTPADDDAQCPEGAACFWYRGINAQGQIDEGIVYSR